MPRSRHDRIVGILYKLSKNYTPFTKIYADHIGKTGYRSIVLTTQTAKSGKAVTHNYQPDLWCKRKNKKIEVFEVWDGQSALTPNIYALSIVCLDKASAELAKKLANLILHKIYNEDAEYLLYPNRFVLIAEVSGDIMKDEKKIEKYLYKQLKFG